MKTFELVVSWTEAGTMMIEADTIEQAIQVAYDSPLPSGTYVSDSFDVDEIIGHPNYIPQLVNREV